MKKLLLSSMIALVLCTGCYSLRSVESLEDATIIKVECKNDLILRQSVVQVLRSAKAYDINYDPEGSFMTIKASYMHRETPRFRVDQIMYDLQAMTGIINVYMEDNHSLVRQAF